MTAYVLSSILWAAGGFALGYIAGNRAGPLWRWLTAAAGKRDDVESERRANRSLGWLLIVLAVAVVGQGALTQLEERADQRERARALVCLGAWAEDFAGALDNRVGATDDRTKAEAAREAALTRVLLTALAVLNERNPTGTAELRDPLRDFRRADQKLARVRAEVEDTRSEHPYPTPPSACIPTDER